MTSKKWLTRGAATAATAGALVVLTTTSSFADTPTQPANTHRVGATVQRLGSTQGFNLYNYSAETFKFVKTTGDLPAPTTADLLPGQKRNLELPVKAFKHTSGEAYYDTYAANGGPQIGTMNVDLNSSGAWNVNFYDMTGKQTIALTVPDSWTGTTMHIEDAAWSDAAQQTYSPGSAAEGTALQQVCVANPSACTFALTSETIGYSSQRLLAEGYNDVNAPGTASLGTQNGYTYTTTDQWGTTAQLGTKILGVVDVQVQASYNHSVSSAYNYGTSWQIQVAAGQTGYIYAGFPQYQDTGTFTVKLGNTTWTLPGVTINNPMSGGSIMYEGKYAQGNVPLAVDPGVNNG